MTQLLQTFNWIIGSPTQAQFLKDFLVFLVFNIYLRGKKTMPLKDYGPAETQNGETSSIS